MNPQMMQMIMSVLGGGGQGNMPRFGIPQMSSNFVPPLPPVQNNISPGGMTNMPMPPQANTQSMSGQQSGFPQAGGPLNQSPGYSSFNPKSNFGMYR